jgi:SAM-dependent methyltransferase
LAADAGFMVNYNLGHVCEEAAYYLTKKPVTVHHVGVDAGLASSTTQETARLSDEMKRLNQVAAERVAVEPAVHPQDFIYSFCCSHPLMSLAGGVTYYFEDGARSASKLADLVHGFKDLDQHQVKLLEFASGYGCVSRHLKKYQSLDLISCDIHPEATQFLTGQLGIKTLLSAHVPEEFPGERKYDVVFALSFFSHMPKSTYGRWLKALYHSLKSPGYLIFTTLGLNACHDHGITPDEVGADGFWFESRSEQHDLDTAEYGMTISTPEYVKNTISNNTDAAIVSYKYCGWWDTQDLWVIKREK